MLASETTRRTTSTGSTGAAAVEWLTGTAACRFVSGERELMGSSLNDRLADVPLRNVKAEVRRGEGPVQKLNRDAGEVLELARGNALIEPKQMADVMGISHSLVLRGLKSADHLSFHRLWELPDEFWAELLVAIAKRRHVARVCTTIEFDRRSA